jgi:hypothetical protein
LAKVAEAFFRQLNTAVEVMAGAGTVLRIMAKGCVEPV